MFRMLLIASLGACGGKPAAQAPSNTASSDVPPTAIAPADVADVCANAKQVDP